MTTRHDDGEDSGVAEAGLEDDGQIARSKVNDDVTFSEPTQRVTNHRFVTVTNI